MLESPFEVWLFENGDFEVAKQIVLGYGNILIVVSEWCSF